jgi:hypothetical protein
MCSPKIVEDLDEEDEVSREALLLTAARIDDASNEEE